MTEEEIKSYVNKVVAEAMEVQHEKIAKRATEFIDYVVESEQRINSILEQFDLRITVGGDVVHGVTVRKANQKI